MESYEDGYVPQLRASKQCNKAPQTPPAGLSPASLRRSVFSNPEVMIEWLDRLQRCEIV
jgi:hypothetical protein